MSEPVISVAPAQLVRDSLSLMTSNHIRHLPVVEEDQVIGIVSIGDLVKDVIEDQQSTIEQLQEYIRT